jgi:hypothetical protein
MSETPTPTPTLAKSVKVTRKPGHTSFDLQVDGQQFPWHLAGDDGVQVAMSTDRVSAVTITILAEHVEIDDQMMRDRAEDVLAGHFHEEMAEQLGLTPADDAEVAR